MVQVTANSEVVELPEGSTISVLLEHLGLTGRVVAVEHNGEPVDRRAVPVTALHAGDRCEIVRAVAGG